MTLSTADHALHKTQCALAATGQLSSEDWTSLQHHCRQCTSCRETLANMLAISREVNFHAALEAQSRPMPAGSLDRFLQRAAAEGIPLRSSQAPSSLRIWAPALAALAVFALMLISMRNVRSAPASGPIVANAVTIPDVPSNQPVAVSASPDDRHQQRRSSNHATRSSAPRPAAPASASPANQVASLAPDRFLHAIPPAYPFFDSSPRPTGTAGYPALSSAQVLHLGLFRTAQEPSTQPTLGLATLYRPDALSPADRSFDFAAGIQQLRFQIPTAQ